MRDWSLAPGDPLILTIPADFRFCTPDYANDHIWELELGGGDPPALALRTTYGLRARQMRIFPRFHVGGQVYADPAAFASQPIVRRFTPSTLQLYFAPIQNLDVTAEYRAMDSHTVAGRFTVANRTGEPLSVLLELCGQMMPLEGKPLSASLQQAVNVLSGYCADLAPLVFLTGGPLPGEGSYPSLLLDLALASGGSRTLTWVQAALPAVEESFDHARRTAARQWEAEMAHIELTHDSQTIEVRTGDPDWDAAFALSQKTAFSLFFKSNTHMPAPSFVLSRQPDQGHSLRKDGSDYSHLWNGQPVLESLYLADLLPAAPDLVRGLLRNYLSIQSGEGDIDWKPGLAGQRGRWLSAPLLVALAWQVTRRGGESEFMAEIFPHLDAFLRRWFHPLQDRDGDDLPEWNDPAQSGLEDHPLFSLWQPASQGGIISCIETPALGAMLCHDLHLLGRMAGDLGRSKDADELLARSAAVRGAVEECWDSRLSLYRLRDRDSHLSPAGKSLASRRGVGLLEVDKSLLHPTRLLVQVHFKGETARRPEIILHGHLDGEEKTEKFERGDFCWSVGRGVATTHLLYTTVDSLEVAGVQSKDKVSLVVMDFSGQDIGSFLPLWAGIPDTARARMLVSRALLDAGRFGRPFGFPCAIPAGSSTPEACQAVLLPWNALIGEGLLEYGFREEAAFLTARLMNAVITSLKTQRAFYRAYHAETGTGIGERNAVQGLAPLGLFLRTLGVEFQSPTRVILSGKNPFPWPVTVKYRGMSVTRQMEKTIVLFPDGGTVTLDDPTEAVVTVE